MTKKNLKSLFVLKADTEKNIIVFTDGVKHFYARNLNASVFNTETLYNLFVRLSKGLLPNSYEIIVDDFTIA